MASPLSLQTSASLHDIFERESDGAIFATLAFIYCPKSDASDTLRDWGCAYWTDAGLPSMGSTITSCIVSLYIYSGTFDSVKGDFFLEDAASPAVPTTGAFNITNRPLTTNFTTKDEANVGVPQWYEIDMKDAMQELVTSYNITAVAFIARPYSDSSRAFTCKSWNEPGNVLGPQIDIVWTEPSAANPRSFGSIMG